MFVLGTLALAGYRLWPKLKKLLPLGPRVAAKTVSLGELVPWLIRPAVRRIIFAMLGLVLTGGGALAILTGLVWLAKGLSDADEFLAKGFGTSVVGLASLWLAFHPRSPLRSDSDH